MENIRASMMRRFLIYSTMAVNNRIDVLRFKFTHAAGRAPSEVKDEARPLYQGFLVVTNSVTGLISSHTTLSKTLGMGDSIVHHLSDAWREWIRRLFKGGNGVPTSSRKMVRKNSLVKTAVCSMWCP